MRLLNVDTLKLEEFFSQDIPPYSILSHVWGDEEVAYHEVGSVTIRSKKGWQKILRCCWKTRFEGLHYTWVDTCCIDKSSSSELSEAINSMFKYYRAADICFAFLEDVTGMPSPASSPAPTEEEADEDVVMVEPDGSRMVLADAELDPEFALEFSSSRWFTRGWTLQELLAPTEVVFLNSQWCDIGTRTSSAGVISKITGIPQHALACSDWEGCSIAQRLSWASGRQTTRVEDQAYCLLGIFGVNMPLIYGEGSKAFLRLQEELLRVFQDYSIFAWRVETERCEQLPAHSGMFAESPSFFKTSGFIRRCDFPPTFRCPETDDREGKMPRLFCEVKPQVIELHLPSFGPYNLFDLELKAVDWQPSMLGRTGNCRNFIKPGLELVVVFLNCAVSNNRVAMVLSFNAKRQAFERSHCPSLIFVSEAAGKAGMYPPKRLQAFSGSELHYKPLEALDDRKPIVVRAVGIAPAGYTQVIPDGRANWKLDKNARVHISHDPKFLVLLPTAPSDIKPPIILQWRRAGGFSWVWCSLMERDQKGTWRPCERPRMQRFDDRSQQLIAFLPHVRAAVVISVRRSPTGYLHTITYDATMGQTHFARTMLPPPYYRPQ
ncbi:hypothetical protein OQA88_5838 [Cercophora sp. LCS_1]